MVSKGVPFDIAFALDPAEVQGYTIIFGELEGATYQWDTGEWSRS